MMSATASQAFASSMSPPSTACSASTEWGGVRTSSWRIIATTGTPGFPSPQHTAGARAVSVARGGRLFRDHRQRHLDVDVAVQVQGDQVLADRADRPARQAHLGALDLVARFLAGLGDIGGADRAEQLALVARLRGDAER